MDFKLYFLIYIAVTIQDQIVWNWRHLYEAKKANYDCAKCKDWSCYSNYCKNKRNSIT